MLTGSAAPVVKRAAIVSAAILWFVSSSAPAQDEPAQVEDVVCARLMEDYILHQVKIETADIDAAVQLIASRGRNNGYWREVFRQFQRHESNGNPSPTPRLLEILTKILQRDGNARWLMAHPEEPSAWSPDIALGPEVVDAIAARARKAQPNQQEPFIITLAVARDPRMKEFLRELLTADPDKVWPATRFFAAIGLAEMGDVAGIRWLVEAAPAGDLYLTKHASAQSGSLLESRVLALDDLTGQKFTTIEQYQAWWAALKTSSATFKPNGRVQLRIP